MIFIISCICNDIITCSIVSDYSGLDGHHIML